MMIKEQKGAQVHIITVGDISVEPVVRKCLAIGADSAVKFDKSPKDSYSTAFEIANYLKNNTYDLIIAGKESLDYNGGAVPGMIAEMLNLPFVNACNGLDFLGDSLSLSREIDGGREIIKASCPLVIGGQKGLVEESQLRIPNMRGIMQARTKPLEVLNSCSDTEFTFSKSFEKPEEKGDCQLIDPNDVAKLVDLLHNEAKVI